MNIRMWGYAWLSYYAANRKVAGSRPNDVKKKFFFNLPIPSGRTSPLGLLSP
jgi:hypothetical protein